MAQQPDRFEPERFLRSMDLHSPESLRRLMRGLEYELTHIVLHPAHKDFCKLTLMEGVAVTKIIFAIQLCHTNTLLLEAVLLFVDGVNLDDLGVMDISKKFAIVGDDEFFEQNNCAVLETLHEAEKRFAKIFGVSAWENGIHEPEPLERRAPGGFHESVISVSRAVEVRNLARSMNCRVHQLELKLQFGTSPYGPRQKLAIGGTAGMDYDYGKNSKGVMTLRPRLPCTWYTGEDDSDCTDVEEEPSFDSDGYETDSTLTTLQTTPTTPSPFKKPRATRVLPLIPAKNLVKIHPAASKVQKKPVSPSKITINLEKLKSKSPPSLVEQLAFISAANSPSPPKITIKTKSPLSQVEKTPKSVVSTGSSSPSRITIKLKSTHSQAEKKPQSVASTGSSPTGKFTIKIRMPVSALVEKKKPQKIQESLRRSTRKRKVVEEVPETPATETTEQVESAPKNASANFVMVGSKKTRVA